MAIAGGANANTTNGAGGAVSVTGGAGKGSGAGGAASLVGGAVTGSGTGGAVNIDGGLSSDGTEGSITIGTTNAEAVSIGRSGKATAIGGTMSTVGATSLATAALMAKGAGWTGTGTLWYHSVVKVGAIFETTIIVDLTGTRSPVHANDIIGADAAADCHIGQITAAVNGTIFAGKMECLELPAGGNVDIDLSTLTIATGNQDVDVTGLTGYAQMLNAGNWANGTMLGLTAVPAANSYLYLSSGAATDADFTGGKLKITLWGA